MSRGTEQLRVCGELRVMYDVGQCSSVFDHRRGGPGGIQLCRIERTSPGAEIGGRTVRLGTRGRAWVVQHLGGERSQFGHRRSGREASHQSLEDSSGGQVGLQNRERKPIRKRAATGCHDPAQPPGLRRSETDQSRVVCVEDGERDCQQQRRDVHRECGAPPRARGRDEPPDECACDRCGDDGRAVLLRLAEAVGNPGLVGDHQGVVRTRGIAAGERAPAGHDRREQEPREERCENDRRHRRDKQPVDRAAQSARREGKHGDVREHEQDRVEEHADAVQQGTRRSLE